MKPLLTLFLPLLFILTLSTCSNNEDDTKLIDAKALRHRNLSLAYIDSGMLIEASTHLDSLEQLLPDEAFVYANQGLVALRQNELGKALELLKKAVAMKKHDAAIALLHSQVAMLTGNFEEAKHILADAVVARPANIHLRWALADQLRGDTSQIDHLAAIIEAIPQNIVARLALTKALVADERLDEARDQLLELQSQGVIQDEQAMGLFTGALDQIDAGKARVARAQIIGLDNVLKPTRAWQHSQLEVAGSPGTVGHPVRAFLNTAVPDWSPTTAVAVTFSKTLHPNNDAEFLHAVLVEVEKQTDLSMVIAGADSTMLVAIDWNNDRILEVAVAMIDGSVSIVDGAQLIAANGSPVTAMTPWDADQDGDLDLLISRGKTLLLRNNGDGTATEISFEGVPSMHSTSIIDYDEDGAVDLVGIDSEHRLVLLRNERSGLIHMIDSPIPDVAMQDVIVGDFNNDGWMDLAWIGEDNTAYIGENNHENSFVSKRIGGQGKALKALDVDNDTRLDVLVIGDTLQIFQSNGITSTIPTTGEVQIIDADQDGDLDIVVNGNDYSVWYQDGTPKNKFQKIILEAILEGGQRNNSLAVGGFVEVRSGGKYQKRLITGPRTHIGLGGSPADVIRVVWPNGVPQEVIEPEANQVFTEVQILKGSCPFLAVKTDDGWEFVTDLLWRSPLGLKINAQTVPPIAATQDWVKVRGDQLTPKDGIYEIAITAQLWETHFIDELKMVAIDHPVGTEIYVDERFVAPVPPSYQMYAYNNIKTPVAAIDQTGKNVLETIRGRDGVRLGGFAKGLYQGIAEDHYIEIDLGNIDETVPIDIIASGWIRPTDTSINIASSQGNHPAPSAIRIDAIDAQGNWTTVIPNAGFPAGKLKTVVLALPANSINPDDARIRITTNLEIYWDQIQFASSNQQVTVTEIPIQLRSADLGYMGYPQMSRTNTNAPNIPDYNDIRSGTLWRDLEGFYTRYGAVEELVSGVDDRYVIMNAGDAMYLQFKVPTKPIPSGMTRDFVFFCDGWVKDGDWNTVDSRTVGPLPFHTMSGYPYPPEELPSVLRPLHQDWQEFHTRYITPAAFRDTLK